MSMDYYVYLKKTFPDKLAFENYAKELGYNLTLHPETDLMNDSGFCPIRFIDARFNDATGTDTFMTGFELYRDIYQPSKQKVTISKGFLGIIRKRVPHKETMLDRAVKGSSTVLYLRCSGSDSFEIMMAYLFGAYCVKHCNGVFDDPQFGCFYRESSAIEKEISTILDELQEEKRLGNLHTHKYEGWI